MPTPLEQFLEDLDRYSTLDANQRAQCRKRAEHLQLADASDVGRVLDVLFDLATRGSSTTGGSSVDRLIRAIARQLGRPRRAAGAESDPRKLSPEVIDRMARLYRELGSENEARFELLTSLAHDRGPVALTSLSGLVANDPPPTARQIDQVLAPLMQSKSYDAQALFPRLLDGLAQREAAAAILDVANFVTRERLVDRHPATERISQLANLLGELVSELERLAENPDGLASSAQELSEKIAAGSELIVAICDAIGLVGDASVATKLYQVLRLSHRRLRAEAGAALARLGDPRGIEVLRDAATDPSARLRALAYLEELGRDHEVPEEYRNRRAIAEAEVAALLSEPSCFGAPPHTIELFDQRRQRWPGYDMSVDTFLVRYEYRFPNGKVSGIGIAGPVTHCLAADLEDLPPTDIYAAYAGWCAEHEDITESDAENLSVDEVEEWQSCKERAIGAGLEQIELVKLGTFFGNRLFVATALRDSLPVVVVTDDDNVEVYPQGSGRKPLGPDVIYYIHKGRKILRVFNPDQT